MKQIITLVLTDLRMTFQDRSTWIFSFLMPIVFTAVLALGSGGAEEDPRVPVLLVNEDGGPVAGQVEASIRASSAIRLFEPAEEEELPADRASALAALPDYTRVVILPAGMSDALLAGASVEAELHLASDHDVQRTQIVQQELQLIFTAQNGAREAAEQATEQAAALQPFASEAERQDYFDAALARARERQATATIDVVRESASALEETTRVATGAEQSSPGQLVTFTLVTLLATASVLAYERTLGTLRRLLTYPVSKASILAGKVLGRYLVGLLQMLLLILVGQWFFGVQWGQSPLALAAMVLSFGLAAVALGVLFATLVRSADQASQLASGAAMIIAAVGGAWWSLELMSGPIRTIAFLLPSAWAMQGFQAIILRGATLADVLPNVAVLLGFAALFFTVGVSRFQYE